MEHYINNKEYPVGTKVDYHDHILKVVEKEEIVNCIDCFFNKFSYCDNVKCTSTERKDGTEVIFEEV